MITFRVINNTISDVYAPGKTLAMMRARFPDWDLREGDENTIVGGQIEIDGVFVAPLESRAQVDEREEETKQRNMRRKLINDLDSEDPAIERNAIKKIFRHLLKEDLT